MNATTQKAITSFAAFKRALSDAETITVINHIRPQVSGPRRIIKAQTNGFLWSLPGSTERCHTHYPHGCRLQVDGNNQVTLFDDDVAFITVIFDNPEVRA